MSNCEEIEIRGVIRLGQLLKLAGLVEDGAQAREIIASGDVAVDGEVETRRGRQLTDEHRIVVSGPGGQRCVTVRRAD